MKYVDKLVIVGLVLSAGCAPSVVSRAGRIPMAEATYVPTAGETLRGPFRSLVTRLHGWGIVVVVGPRIPGTFGSMDATTGTIYIDPDMPVNGQFEVLAHEAGHLFHSRGLPSDVAEVFAELVSVGVCRYYGHDARDSSARYLAGRKSGLASAPYLQQDVERAVKALTGRGPAPW